MLQRPCHAPHPRRAKDLDAPVAPVHRIVELWRSMETAARTYFVQATAVAVADPKGEAQGRRLAIKA